MEGSRILQPGQIPPPGGKMMAINVQLKKDVVIAAALEVMKELGFEEKMARLERIEGLLEAVADTLGVPLTVRELKKQEAEVKT